MAQNDSLAIAFALAEMGGQLARRGFVDPKPFDELATSMEGSDNSELLAIAPTLRAVANGIRARLPDGFDPAGHDAANRSDEMGRINAIEHMLTFTLAVASRGAGLSDRQFADFRNQSVAAAETAQVVKPGTPLEDYALTQHVAGHLDRLWEDAGKSRDGDTLAQRSGPGGR